MQVAPEALLNLSHQPHRRDGVAAEVEEVVGDADGADAEHILPDERELKFERVAGRDEGD